MLSHSANTLSTSLKKGVTNIVGLLTPLIYLIAHEVLPKPQGASITDTSFRLPFIVPSALYCLLFKITFSIFQSPLIIYLGGKILLLTFLIYRFTLLLNIQVSYE